MGHSKAREPIAVQVHLGAVSATATRTAGWLPPNGDYQVAAIHIADPTAITGDNTNYYGFSFNKGTAASPTAIVTYSFTAGNDLTANLPKSISLSAVADATLNLTATDVLHVVATKNGGATNLTDCVVTFSVIPVRNPVRTL